MAIENSNTKNLNPARAGTFTDPSKKSVQALGIPTKFDTSKYKISQHQYPNDLFDSQATYGGNYAIFYINIAAESKLMPKDKKTGIVDDVPFQKRGDIVGENVNKLTATGAGFVLGALQGVGAGAILSGKSNIKQFTSGAFKGGVVGASAASIVALNAAGMGRQQKRIESAICLHVPNQLNIKYSMQWQDDETFAYQAATIGSEEVAKAIGSIGSTRGKSNMGGVANAVLTNIALSRTPLIASALSAASGLAANPKKEQIFKNVNFREFTFDYTFSPRNATEAKNVREIIYLFKLHMHPEYKDKDNFIFVYPSEFDIMYYQGGQENLNLHRHTSCVLVDMEVDYTPNGSFNTFADGMPTQINVTLHFLELAILTKENIQDKF